MSKTTVDQAAGAILETVPVTMRLIRQQMRAAGTAGISVAQFRLLLYVRRNPGTSLSPVADHLGTTLPSASQLAERLVRAGLLSRVSSKVERRRVELRLTEEGAAKLAESDARTRAWLRSELATLTGAQLDRLVAALHDLRTLVVETPTPGTEKAPDPQG